MSGSRAGALLIATLCLVLTGCGRDRAGRLLQPSQPSAPATVASSGTNIAPTVQITVPSPNHLIATIVPPSFRVRWVGSDPDGPNGLPAKYKFHLFDPSDPSFDFNVALANPDSLRRAFAPTFPGWESLPGESTSVAVSGLVEGREYLFVIVALDAQGAYNPVFSLDTNMLRMLCMPANVGAPTLTVSNPTFTYTTDGSGAPDGPVTTIEQAALQPVRFFWSAAVPRFAPGIAAYRWRFSSPMVGGQRGRPGQWSPWGATTSTTIDLVPSLSPDTLAIQAMDELGRVGGVRVAITAIRPGAPGAGRL